VHSAVAYFQKNNGILIKCNLGFLRFFPLKKAQEWKTLRIMRKFLPYILISIAVFTAGIFTPLKQAQAAVSFGTVTPISITGTSASFSVTVLNTESGYEANPLIGNSCDADAVCLRIWNVDPQTLTGASDAATLNPYIVYNGSFPITDNTASQTVSTPIISGLSINTTYYFWAALKKGSTITRITQPFTTAASSSGTGQLTGNATTSSGGSLTNVFGQMYDCGISTLLTDCVVGLLDKIIYPISSMFLTASARLFDVFANFTLSSSLYGNGSGFVTTGWGIIRDFANIGFIVALVYIGFKTILGLHSGHDKATLVSVIIIALLINFSLFITRVVIDSSNITALIFYNQISISGTPEKQLTKTEVPQVDLSRGLVEGMSIQKVISQDFVNSAKNAGSTVTVAAVILVLGIAINCIAAWTFFVAAMLFLGRIVGLWLVMIFAPYAFVSYILPAGLADKKFGWRDWWSELFSLSFLAPIFLFFIWIIILFIAPNPATHKTFLDGILQADIAQADSAANPINGLVGMMVKLLLQFAVIIIMFKSAKDLAQKMAGEVGGALVKAGTAALGIAGGVAIGAVGFAGRKTLGAVSEKVSQRQDLIAASNKKGVGGFMAKLALKTTDYGAKSNFDLRKSGVGGVLGGIGAAVGAGGVNMDNKYLKTFGLSASSGKGGERASIEKKEFDIQKEADRIKVNEDNYKKSPEYKKYDEKYQKEYAAESEKAKARDGANFNEEQFKNDFKKNFASANGSAPTMATINTERMKAFQDKLAAGGSGLVAALGQSAAGLESSKTQDKAGTVIGTGLTGTAALKTAGVVGGITGAISGGVLAAVIAGNERGSKEARERASSKIGREQDKLAKIAEEADVQKQILAELKDKKNTNYQPSSVQAENNDGTPKTDTAGRPVMMTNMEAAEHNSAALGTKLDRTNQELRLMVDKTMAMKSSLDGLKARGAKPEVIKAAENEYNTATRDRTQLEAEVIRTFKDKGRAEEEFRTRKNVDGEIMKTERNIDRLDQKGKAIKTDKEKVAEKFAKQSGGGGGGHAPASAPASPPSGGGGGGGPAHH